MLDPETLFDDICCADPDKVAAALRAASGRGAELAPGILSRIEHALREPDAWTGEKKPFVGFLLFLAAEFRLAEAHAQIVRLFRLGDDRTSRMLSDITTEGAPAILADTFGGDPEPLYTLVDDRNAGPFDRGAGLRALAILVHRGLHSRERLLEHMTRLASTLDERNEQDPLVGNQIVEVAVQLHAVEIRDLVLGLYDRGVAEDVYFEPEYTEAQLRPDAPPAAEAGDLEARITSAWGSVQDWAFFDSGESEADESIDLEPEGRFLAEHPFDDPEHTPYRAPPKVGRNDPCPCGSGKKFKKCCGR